ncbi:MAG: hypothetical protein BroJett022_21470 [Actinomycetes bacterium]|nr:MAG: hypothetical protein BroJett022_21470 [Actinomycetes bacterium]
MDEIFWIPIGAIVAGLLLGMIVGARSRSSSAGSGALVGIALAIMATFPLWAIGLSNA